MRNSKRIRKRIRKGTRKRVRRLADSQAGRECMATTLEIPKDDRIVRYLAPDAGRGQSTYLMRAVLRT